MECPTTWNLLTSSLAVIELNRPMSAWAFLAVQELVRNEPADRDTFCLILSDEPESVTGPSFPARVAARLQHAGLALPAAEKPDPRGRLAFARRLMLDLWSGNRDFAAPDLRNCISVCDPLVVDTDPARWAFQVLASELPDESP